MKDVLACLFLKLKKALLMTELIYAYEIYKGKLKKNNCRWEKWVKQWKKIVCMGIKFILEIYVYRQK